MSPSDDQASADGALTADDLQWLARQAQTVGADWAAHGVAGLGTELAADSPAACQPAAALFQAMYLQLRRRAASYLRQEPAGHTLSATALAHEAWLRLSAQALPAGLDRGHFLALASLMMRRILVGHARAKRAAKRDAELVGLTLGEAAEVAQGPGADIEALHEALLAFEQLEPRAAKVVELKFFGGMELQDIAQALDISLATVKRDWTLARAWLRRELN